MGVPYPRPTSPNVTAIMRGNRKRDTVPELALRSALHARGVRYRVAKPIFASGVRVVPDIVFGRQRVAVFVDGCLWHRCPQHGVMPRANTGYWLPKLTRNVERDRRVDEALTDGGWMVVRIWEHAVRADADGAASLVVALVARHRISQPQESSQRAIRTRR